MGVRESGSFLFRREGIVWSVIQYNKEACKNSDSLLYGWLVESLIAALCSVCLPLRNAQQLGNIRCRLAVFAVPQALFSIISLDLLAYTLG